MSNEAADLENDAQILLAKQSQCGCDLQSAMPWRCCDSVENVVHFM